MFCDTFLLELNEQVLESGNIYVIYDPGGGAAGCSKYSVWKSNF